MKVTRILLLLLTSLSFAACQQDSSESLSKAEAARQQEKADDGTDFCEIFDWYGDGECDTFCPLPDPDCGQANCPDPADPEVHYVSEEVGECAAILFACEPWQTAFSDECGCGCIGPEEEPPAFCGGFANFQCEDGFECVDDPTDDCELGDGADCGGICVPETASCPDASDPEVHYISEDVSECLAILFACEPWQTGFSDECGCGCLGPEEPAFCGGFANFQCEDGFVCVDDPRDDCQFGDGADCGGMCILE